MNETIGHHQKSRRVFGLDLIRATAILLILCSHSVVLLAPNSTSSLAFAIKFLGTIGVDVFFVLSGFLIGSILLKQIKANKTTLRDFLYFWLRRWFRTLPNYYLVLFINIILLFVFQNQLISGIWKFFFFCQNFNSAQIDFFTESWSLSIEEFAYVFMPLLLLVIGLFQNKITHKTYLVVTFFSIVIITFNRCYFNFFLVDETIVWSSSLRKVVIYRLDSIYYGFLAAYFFFYYKKIWHKYRYMFTIFGSVVFIAIHLYLFFNSMFPSVLSSFFNTLYLPLLSLSILLFFPLVYSFQIEGKLKQIITKISLWSYSLYLVNYSIVLLCLQYFFNIEDFTLLQNTLVLIVFWMVSFILAVFLFKFYETPLTNFRDSTILKQILNIKN